MRKYKCAKGENKDMTFGEKLSKLRREHGYTQEQLSDILGVSRQSISKWESDLAYPETEKLIRMSDLFSCSMDFLLKEDVTEKTSIEKDPETFWDKCKKQFRERKSEKMIFGMPLYHIGRNAHGFFAVGWRAKGIFSIGMISRGIFSLGLLSFGILSVGLLTLGLIAAGVFSFGFLALGAIALGALAFGAISIGIVSFGALSWGCFSAGALAIGKYAAAGDHAYAMIAIGKTAAEGSVYQHIGKISPSDILYITEWLDANVPVWLGWAKEIFKFFML